jgi:hypothetical protein
MAKTVPYLLFFFSVVFLLTVYFSSCLLLWTIRWLTCSRSLHQHLVRCLCTLFPLLHTSPRVSHPRIFFHFSLISLIFFIFQFKFKNSPCSSFVQIPSWNLNMNCSWTPPLVHEHVQKKGKNCERNLNLCMNRSWTREQGILFDLFMNKNLTWDPW